MAGINRKTGLPERFSNSDPNDINAIVEEISNVLTVNDIEQYLGRYEWDKLPKNSVLNTNLIERMLYYKYSLMMFKYQEQMFLLPYALAGSIDVYGHYMAVTPLPFGGPTTTETKDGKTKPWIEGLIRTPVRTLEECTDPDTQCVLLYDYSRNISQMQTPRYILDKVFNNMCAEYPALMRTALVNSCGIQGVRVNDEGVAQIVRDASNACLKAALNGERFIPLPSSVPIQEIGDGANVSATEFMMGMNSINNLRLTSLGIDNSGSFEKQGTMLESEQSSGSAATSLILQDGLNNRQHFLELSNKLFGESSTVKVAEPEMMTVDGADFNMDESDGLALKDNGPTEGTTGGDKNV